ncbi:CoA ester lyase [Bradyrhizobium sp. CB82]|uniref:HpcH/HpaI aldolase/citrate lyase family protein n=1 Tax=Bradyrhizobium sp. CB82 TaxID=3039159 RepID=UPI0024B1D4A4|nr:CoA ester lyase [Bradyrhizobium sp. CB82]WFU42213.1 CoA ester lyase [Bradyrhizobium sp. CB82]
MSDPFLALFIPATRPERFYKAASSGADAIVIDLEDAVAAHDRASARRTLRALLPTQALPGEVIIRVNGPRTADHDEDVRLLEDLPSSIGIMLAKTEQCEDVSRLADLLPGRFTIGLVETATGIANARHLAPLCTRVAFGSIDYANSIGAVHSTRALLAARSELVFASALSRAAAPLDGVTTSIGDESEIESDASVARELGFRGKLLIHPKQVVPALRGMAPPAADLEHARAVLAAGRGDAHGVDGTMVDAPVVEAARRIAEDHDRIHRRIDAVACRSPSTS